jgi:hypothetical protein
VAGSTSQPLAASVTVGGRARAAAGQALLNVSDGGLAIAAAARLATLHDEIVMDVLAYVAWPVFGT